MHGLDEVLVGRIRPKAVIREPRTAWPGSRITLASLANPPYSPALIATIAVLLVGFWAGESPDTDERVFQKDDRAVALGRLAECMSWSDRPVPVDVRVVPDSGEVALIQLPPIQLLGKTPNAASALLIKRYREKFPDRKVPRLQVALVRGDAEYEHVRIDYLMSLRAMIHHDCLGLPGDPELNDYQAPPPGVPGILDDLA